MVDGCIPEDLHEALLRISEQDLTVVAGGTDLMVRHARYSGISPRLNSEPLFIGGLAELKGVTCADGEVRTGACTTLSELEDSPFTSSALKTVIRDFASPAVRNAGTVGGNICNTSPAGDTLPYLYSVNARVVLKSLHSERELFLRDFISGPGGTVRRTDELVTEIIWSEPFEHDSWRWRKIGQRKANALSKLSVFASWICDADEGPAFSCAVGGAAPTVIRDPAAEAAGSAYLRAGTERERASAAALAENTLKAALSPIDDQRSTARYRKETAVNLAMRFLREAARSMEES